MEWIRVEFPIERDVFVDDQQLGKTNKKLAVGEGTHKFTLGEPVNYLPAKIIVVVTGTTEEFPLRLNFARMVF